MDLLAAALDQPATYLEWGWLSISVPNLIVLMIMVVLFVAALLIPFPKDGEDG
jgi:hypothetical protein